MSGDQITWFLSLSSLFPSCSLSHLTLLLISPLTHRIQDEEFVAGRQHLSFQKGRRSCTSGQGPESGNANSPCSTLGSNKQEPHTADAGAYQYKVLDRYQIAKLCPACISHHKNRPLCLAFFLIVPEPLFL